MSLAAWAIWMIVIAVGSLAWDLARRAPWQN